MVFPSPAVHFLPRFPKIAEPTQVQALVAKLALEAFHPPFCIGRPAGLDVHQLNLTLHAPGQEVSAGQFRPIVAAQILGPTAVLDQPFPHPGHSTTGQTRVHFQRQAFSRISIQHTPHTDSLPGSQHVMHEIQRPLLLRPPQHLGSQPPAYQPLHPQPRFPIRSPHAFVIHPFTTPFQQHLQPPLAKPRLLSRQPHQLLPQLALSLALLPVSVTPHGNLHQPASPPLARTKGGPQIPHLDPYPCELQPFFGSPPATYPCPGSDPPPASSAAGSRLPVAPAAELR
jgi:hypothetical protein